MKNENKYKILIIDDSELNRTILSDILEDKFTILEASDGIEGIEILKQQSDEISLILLDLVMPNMDGLEVLAVMNRYDWIDNIPVIMISSENSPAYIERAYELGVTDFINRPFNVFVVRKRVANTIMLYAKQKSLISLLNQQFYEKEKNIDLMLNILSHIVEFRNGESGLHILHVNTITEIILKHLVQKTDKYQLTNEEIDTIVVASSLHDIGKISIPDEILNKPDKLTKEEFEIMKGHTKAGADMINSIPDFTGEPLLKTANEICLYHHEKYDGKGYPFGLIGDEIPISAQVVSIADVYDAITSERCYKPSFTHKEAIQMIKNGECGSFNPILVECLEDVSDILEKNLKVKSPERMNMYKIKMMTDDLLRQNHFSVANNSINYLEQERIKNEFFASLSQEIQFEFTQSPPVLMISDWCVEKYGFQKVIYNPLNNKKLLDFIGGEKTVDIFREEISKTTIECPVTQFVIMANINNQKRHYRVHCRVNRTSDINSEIIGIIGKMNDIEDEQQKILSLKRSASIDTLTSVYNRGHCEGLIKNILAENKNKKYALMLFDVDNFKSANDTYGHLFGDKVLKKIATSLLEYSNNNIVARIGGDEFLVFAEYGNESELHKFTEDIFKKINSIAFDSYKVSLSLGVAETVSAGYSYNDLFLCADSALYHSKRHGREKITYYNETMEFSEMNVTPIDLSEN